MFYLFHLHIILSSATPFLGNASIVSLQVKINRRVTNFLIYGKSMTKSNISQVLKTFITQ